MTKDFQGKLALVTGASRGIGRAMAMELARRGAHVIALARTQGALEELDDAIQAIGGQATLTPCDLKDFEAIDRLGAAIYERWGRLDVFVGNAGQLGVLTPIAHCDAKIWDTVFAVNVTANYRLLRSLDLPLRSAEAGRVLMVSSSAAHKANPFWGPYAASKAAMESLARAYASETAQLTNVRLTLTNPGPLRTRMRAAAMPGEDPSTLRTPEDFAAKAVFYCSSDWLETGLLYDFPQDRILHYSPPA